MGMRIASIGQRSALAVFRTAVGSVFLLWMVFCCVHSASADHAPSWVIRLTVVDEKSQAAPGAAVEAFLGEKRVTISTTDAAGKATLTVNLPGIYSLKIWKSGKWMLVRTSTSMWCSVPRP